MLPKSVERSPSQDVISMSVSLVTAMMPCDFSPCRALCGPLTNDRSVRRLPLGTLGSPRSVVEALPMVSGVPCRFFEGVLRLE